MAFQYEPLQRDHIRLLKPVSGNKNTISFKLIHVSVLSKPKYTALSYTWDNMDEPYQSVTVNGCQFVIRANLHNALSQIIESRHVRRHLWVDAICINQGKDKEATDERSLQVSRMNEIYTQAREVVVWLGKPENPTNNRLACQLIWQFVRRYIKIANTAHPLWKRAGRYVFPHAPEGREVHAMFLRSLSPTIDKTFFDAPGTTTHNAWLGMVAMFKSRWWTRTWVYQESTVPDIEPFCFVEGWTYKPCKTKIRFLFGDQSTTWLHLGIASDVAVFFSRVPELHSEFLADMSETFFNIFSLRTRRAVQHLSHFTLLDYLQIFRGSDCQDPRDKVYAPLCLASEEVRAQIRPNYTDKSVLDVYMDVARCYLSLAGPGSLDFLGLARFQEDAALVATPGGSESVIPSWVPNLSVELGYIPMPKRLHVPKHTDIERGLFKNLSGLPTPLSTRRALKGVEPTQTPAFRPLEGVTPNSYIKGNELFVEGILIDFVQDTMRAAEREEASRVTGEWDTDELEWGALMKYKYFTGESLYEVYRHSFVMDLAYDSWGRPRARGGVWDVDVPVETWKTSSIDEHLRLEQHTIATNMALRQREVALTRSHHYIAVVPKTAKVGDSIWALAGGQVLYLLRSVDEEFKQFQFIGESYVHGLMDGEISEGLREGRTKLWPISLV